MPIENNNNVGLEKNNQDQPKTYSEDEYNKLIEEIDEYKRVKDNLSKEIADYKRKAKDKLTEDEKKEQERLEKEEALANVQKELLSIKMSKEFLVCGFDETTTNTIIESFNKGDSVEFAKTLSNEIKKLVENVRKEEKENFQKSSILPPNGTHPNKTDKDPLLDMYLAKKKSQNKAEEMLFGNKK